MTTTQPITAIVIDVAAQAREMFGAVADIIAGQPLPAHDWRFEATTPTGGRVTFHAGATAAHVVDHFNQLAEETR